MSSASRTNPRTPQLSTTLPEQTSAGETARTQPNFPHGGQWPTRSSSSHDPSRYHRRSGNHHIFDNDLPSPPILEMSLESRRQSLIALDRKRRLTGSISETGRRRTVSGGFRTREEQLQQQHYRNATDSIDNNHNVNNNNNTAEVIDLTSSPPQRTTPPSTFTAPPRRTSSHSSRMYIVPQWQPDSEVSECPICQRQFGILFRRHHCRKCGRVVCNDCSPHRITIPRQFIVHPPTTAPVSPARSGPETIDLTGDDGDIRPIVVHGRAAAMNHGLGGGEKVRLCNPCVPDPQPDPQSGFSPFQAPTINSPTDRIPSTSFHRSLEHNFLSHHERRQPGNRHPFPHPGTRIEVEEDEREVDQDDEDEDSGSSSENYTFQRHLMNVLNQHRYPRNGPMHSRYHSTGTAQPPLSLSSSTAAMHVNRPRVRSMLDPLPHHGQTRTITAGSLPISTSRVTRLRVREEDMCPICRRELPAKDLNGDETARESHIMQCIAQHDTSTLRATTRNRSHSQPESASQTQIAPVDSMPSSSSSAQRVPTQMLRFTATEKDCLGEDGNAQECSICMIEYDVGDSLARLECWCKFHDECIVEWFARKRECPVHKIA